MHLAVRSALALTVVALLSGCDPAGFALPGATPVSSTVPEGVRAMADPRQNVDTARVLPEDGCYWYEHAGPVETTLLPLRTPQGQPICTAAAAEAPTEA